MRALLFLVAGLAFTAFACSSGEPTGNAVKSIPFIGDETPLAKVMANTDEYVGKTFIVVGGIRIADYYNNKYRFAKGTHVSFHFTEVRMGGSRGDSMTLYASRSIAGPLVEEVSRVSGPTKAVRAKITFLPERYSGSSGMAELLARIFHKCYAAARRGGRLAGKVAAEAGITASARNPPLPP